MAVENRIARIETEVAALSRRNSMDPFRAMVARMPTNELRALVRAFETDDVIETRRLLARAIQNWGT